MACGTIWKTQGVQVAGQWRKSKSLEIQQESSLSQQKVISPFDFKNYWKIITIKDTNNYFGFTDIKLHRLYFIEETILYLGIKANICLDFKKSLFSLSTIVQY